MNVLVIAPHPDDEAIGCGGSLIRHADAGDRVHVVFATSGEHSLPDLDREEVWRVREQEARAAAHVLGIARLSFWRLPDWHLGDEVPRLVSGLTELVERERPERVYAPHPAEWHPDHRAASAATAEMALRCGLSTWSVLGFEVWTPIADLDFVEDITGAMPRKLEAIGCYESQLAQIDYRRGVEGLNAYRGALSARSAYAEVFARIDGRDE